MSYLIAAALLFGLIQLAVLRLTERRARFLRWAGLAVPALLAWRGHWYLHAPFEDYPHHEGTAGTVLYLLAGLLLLG